MYTKKGFTLIELVIVIAILGILAGIAVPHFMETSASARGAKVLADLRTIDSACTIYTINNGTEPADIETLVKADLLASEPLANVETFIITKTNGTATPYNPNEFERKIYTIANGRGTYGSDNQTVEWYLNGDGSVVDNGTMADNMDDIIKILQGPGHNIDSLNAYISGSYAEQVLQELKAAGLDLEALGAVYWKYDATAKMLYWSNSDISNLAAGTTLPVIRYNTKTGTYTVWKATITSVKENIGQAGEHIYNTINNDISNDSANGYKPSTGDKKENQTYDKAMEHYQNALANTDWMK